MESLSGLGWDFFSFGLGGVFWIFMGLSVAAGSPLATVVGRREGLRSAALVLIGSIVSTLIFYALTSALRVYSPDLLVQLASASGVEAIRYRFIFAASLAMVIPILLHGWIWRSPRARDRYKQFLGGFFASTLIVAFIAQALGFSSDIAADVVGKVEAGIPEDDMRNPMVAASVLLRPVWVASTIQVMLLLGLTTSAVLFSLHHRSRQDMNPPSLRRSWWLIPAWGVVAVWLFFLDQNDFLRPAAEASITGSGTGLAKGLSSVFILVGLAVLLIGLIWFNRRLFRWRSLTVLVSGLLSLGVALIISDVASHHALEMALFVSDQMDTSANYENLLSLLEAKKVDLPLMSALFLVVLLGLCGCVALDRVSREGSTQDLVKSMLIGLGVALLILATALDITPSVIGTGINETRRQFAEIPGIMTWEQVAMPVVAIQLMLASLLEQAWPLLIVAVLGIIFLWRPRFPGLDSRGVAAGMVTTAGIFFSVGLFWLLIGEGAVTNPFKVLTH
jgi:hypothetical protein